MSSALKFIAKGEFIWTSVAPSIGTVEITRGGVTSPAPVVVRKNSVCV